MYRKQMAERLQAELWQDVGGKDCRLFDAGGLTHLQFRRFAGCPVCNLHLHDFAARHAELAAQGIRELVVFHSPRESLLPHVGRLPFALIADPERRLYQAFGVAPSWRAMLHPRAWLAGLRGLLAHGLKLPARGEGLLGLPADFLIDGEGRIVALKYGMHADDQWSVDELLALARGQAGAAS